jgi:hypothetical protein
MATSALFSDLKYPPVSSAFPLFLEPTSTPLLSTRLMPRSLPSQRNSILVPCSLKPISSLQPFVTLPYHCFISRAPFRADPLFHFIRCIQNILLRPDL